MPAKTPPAPRHERRSASERADRHQAERLRTLLGRELVLATCDLGARIFKSVSAAKRCVHERRGEPL